MSFPYVVGLAYGREKKFTSTKYHPLGTKGQTPDGRVFYYAQAGGANLVGNTLVQSKIVEGTSQHAVALTPSTSVGDWSGSNIPTGSASIGVVWVTAHASGEFTDGMMTVETTPGTGQYRIVADSDSGSSNTVTVIRLHPQDTIQDAALTTVSKLGFHHNPYASVIITPATTLTNVLLGVTPVAVTAANYFWLQTSGQAAIRYTTIVPAIIADAVVAGISDTAGSVVGHPKSTNTVASVDAGATVTGVAANAARPVIGYAMDAVPGDGDLLKVMLSIRA